MEQHTVVYRISMPKCLNFITYFNRRLGTWLQLCQLNVLLNTLGYKCELVCHLIIITIAQFGMRIKILSR